MPTAEQYQAKVSAYFFVTLGRPASADELAAYTQVLADNNGSVWKPAGASLVSYLTPLLETATAGKNNGQIVTEMFERMTGSQPSMELYNYYVGMLNQGTIKLKGLANAMLNDLKLMPNVDGGFDQPSNWTIDLSDKLLPGQRDAMIAKTGVAVEFTKHLDTVTENNAFKNDPSLAVQLLAGVTDDATAQTAKGQIDQTITDIVSGGGSAGQTYTLTLNPDTKTGTSGNDTFNGVKDSNANVTFNSFDQLDGGDGTDTLIAQGIGNLTTNTSTLKNIEKLHLVGAAGTNTLDLTNTTGVTHITSEGATAKYTVAGIGQGIERIDVLAPAGATQTFTFQSGAVSGSADSLTLGLQSLGTGASKTINVNPVSGTNGFETLNIELSGGASGKDGKAVVINDGNATTLTTVNVSGSASGALDLTNPASVTTVDASKASGGVVFNLAYAKDITVTGGEGNDEFQFAGTLNDKDVVDGGKGTDTLAANGAQFGAFTTTASNISGIERIRIQDAAKATIDVSFFGVNYVRVADRNAGTLTLNNLSSGSTIRFDDDATAAGNALNIKNAAGGKADSISLDLREGSAGSGVLATINDVETINVTTEDAKNAAILNLTANDAAAKGYGLTVNLTGDNALTLNLTSTHGTNTVDGSAMTAALNANLDAVTGGPATLKGGSAADTLMGGDGADTLTGNGGKDKFVFNNFGAADTITDFSASADDLYIDAQKAVFNAATKASGVAYVGTMVNIWNTAGMNVTALTMALANTISMAVNVSKASRLFTAANKSALTAAVKAAVKANSDARGVAFGRVGTTLYLVYVGDTVTAMASSGTKISAVRTIAKVGAGFTAADLFIY